MLTQWIPMVIPLVATVLWLWVPGLPIALALRLRPAAVWALSPLLSIALIAVAAILAPMVGWRWGPLPVVLLALAAGILAWVLRLAPPHLRLRRTARRGTASEDIVGTAPHVPDDEVPGAVAEPHAASSPGSARQGAPGARPRVRLGSRVRSLGAITLGSFLISALLMARHVRNVLDRPDALSQTFDNIFHQSAVRWILEHGDASSLRLLSMTATPGDPTFYPAAWHDIVSLVLLSTGSTDIPLATNALVLATGALVWTAGSVLLIRACLPSSLVRYGLPLGAVLAASFPTFPLLFMKFGVLYPNLLSVALLPAMLVLVLRFVGLAPRERLSPVAVVVLGVIGAVALSLSHPNGSMSLVAMAIPIAVAGGVRALARVRNPRVGGHLMHGAALLLLAVAALAAASWIWPIIRPPAEALGWPPIVSTAEALGQALLLNPVEGWPRWILGVLLVIGLARCIRAGDLALPLSWGVVVYLWLVIASWPEGEARSALVGVWYNDPYRIAAVLTIPSLPLAAIGAAHLADLVARRLPRATRSWRGPVLGITATLALALGTQAAPWMNHAVSVASGFYQLTDRSQLLTVDETRLLEEIPGIVPEDAVIVTDAWNGSSLAYAYTGRHTTTRHTLEYLSPDVVLLHERLDEAADDPEVCAAIQRLGAGYVLDFGPDQINHFENSRAGYDDLADAPGFTLVASEGSAKLYRIEACRS